MKKTMIAKVNGKGFENGHISKKTLERNALDILTCTRDFEESLEFVEEADRQTLLNFLREYDLAEDGEAVIEKYLG